MSFKKLRILRAEFSPDIAGHQIPAFRGAVAAKAGYENDKFHNHEGNNSLKYRYPLIQFKRIRGQPSLLCIDEGVDEVHHFFNATPWELDLNGKPVNLNLEKLDVNQYVMQVWDKFFPYKIRNWIALNQEAYRQFHQLDSEIEQRKMLEKKLIGNIISMAKGIDWTVEKNIELRITGNIDWHLVQFKGQTFQGFSLEFETNVFLPPLLGLGKGVSLGYGTVIPQKNNNQ